MSKKTPETPEKTKEEAATATPGAEATSENAVTPRFQITGQYVKDLSYENPAAPHNLSLQDKPAINVNIDLGAQKLGDDLYEVAIKVNASAELPTRKLFVIELVYAGLFQISGVPNDRLEAILFVDCPFVLFPYARRVVSDLTRDGGFPPLLLEPIDFFNLYRRRLEAQAAQNQTANGETTVQ